MKDDRDSIRRIGVQCPYKNQTVMLGFRTQNKVLNVKWYFMHVQSHGPSYRGADKSLARPPRRLLIKFTS